MFVPFTVTVIVPVVARSARPAGTLRVVVSVPLFTTPVIVAPFPFADAVGDVGDMPPHAAAPSAVTTAIARTKYES
jgi:hypothetical protein